MATDTSKEWTLQGTTLTKEQTSIHQPHSKGKMPASTVMRREIWNTHTKEDHSVKRYSTPKVQQTSQREQYLQCEITNPKHTGKSTGQKENMSFIEEGRGEKGTSEKKEQEKNEQERRRKRRKRNMQEEGKKEKM